MIPNVVHFVFGLQEQNEPFHFGHYVSIESCRRVIKPDTIYFHYQHLPYGEWWDLIAPYVTLIEVDLVQDVVDTDYSSGNVPASYRYAHHADFIRLDALVSYGGIYADIDTIFVRPFPPDLFTAPFVIGAEMPVRDEQTGELRPSLCNALMMSEKGSPFARAWRERMPDALNGTWSNHSGFLAQALSDEMPEDVRVEPQTTFFPFAYDASGLAQLFTEKHTLPTSTLSVHLWAHLWWQRSRRDFSVANARWSTPFGIRHGHSTFAELMRPYLPQDGSEDRGVGLESATNVRNWTYLSFDQASGYGIAADRYIDALEGSGQSISWVPLVDGASWHLGYNPPQVFYPLLDANIPSSEQLIIAQLVPEYFPIVREHCGDAFLVGQTAWETDQIPAHWVDCLNATDLLIVPSRFSAAAIANSSVTTPVEVVAYVAPTIRCHVSPTWSDIPKDRFVFYVIGECNERKAVFHSIEAYLRAFTGDDPVLLVVKTSHRDFRLPAPAGRRTVEKGTSAWTLAETLAGHRNPPAVKLVTRELTNDDIGALHVRGDCFVSLCRSEGWGLGAFDAAAYGNPVVTTGYGGQLEYLAGSPFLVDFELVAVQDPVGFPSYAPDQHWAEPDIDHGAALLRRVLSERDKAAEFATARALDMQERYQADNVVNAFIESVATHRGFSSADLYLS